MPPVIGDEAVAQLRSAMVWRGGSRARAQPTTLPGRGPCRREAISNSRRELLGEIRRDDQARSPRGRRVTIGVAAEAVSLLVWCDVAILAIAGDHPIASRLAASGKRCGFVIVRRLRQGWQGRRRLLDGQLIERLVEVVDRRGSHPIGPAAEDRFRSGKAREMRSSTILAPMRSSASKASLIFRSSENLVGQTEKFFATCWVIVSKPRPDADRADHARNW